MSKLFDEMSQGLREAAAIQRGELDQDAYRVHVPDTVDVRSIRKGLKLTQSAFATCFGFSPGAVRDWEQGRKTPETAARLLLRVIEREPQAVRRALGRA